MGIERVQLVCHDLHYTTHGHGHHTDIFTISKILVLVELHSELEANMLRKKRSRVQGTERLALISIGL